MRKGSVVWTHVCTYMQRVVMWSKHDTLSQHASGSALNMTTSVGRRRPTVATITTTSRSQQTKGITHSARGQGPGVKTSPVVFRGQLGVGERKKQLARYTVQCPPVVVSGHQHGPVLQQPVNTALLSSMQTQTQTHWSVLTKILSRYE